MFLASACVCPSPHTARLPSLPLLFPSFPSLQRSSPEETPACTQGHFPGSGTPSRCLWLPGSPSPTQASRPRMWTTGQQMCVLLSLHPGAEPLLACSQCSVWTEPRPSSLCTGPTRLSSHAPGFWLSPTATYVAFLSALLSPRPEGRGRVGPEHEAQATGRVSARWTDHLRVHTWLWFPPRRPVWGPRRWGKLAFKFPSAACWGAVCSVFEREANV